ncbi:MAG: Dyp-type peroxidase, partial [Acidobacteriota bacterium]
AQVPSPGAASGLALVGSNVGAAASVSGAVGSVAGDVAGKVLGGGASSITNVGVRASVTASDVSGDLPANVHGFNQNIEGVENFTMPATQHDALVWLSGSAYDIVFDMARSVINGLASHAHLADETSSWPYQHDRDLTGFIDGSENPTLLDAPSYALIPEGQPGAAGSVLLLQKWSHNVAAWEAVPVAHQEKIMGRTKPDSTELENKPADSHVARTDQDEFGHIFRRNMPYGTVSAHGTMFVGFCATQQPLAKMLDSMAGLVNGKRDALTRYTTPETGAFYFVPSVETLRNLR